MTEKVLNDLAIKANSYCAQNNQFETTYNSTFRIRGFDPKEMGEHLNEEVCALSYRMHNNILYIYLYIQRNGDNWPDIIFYENKQSAYFIIS